MNLGLLEKIYTTVFDNTGDKKLIFKIKKVTCYENSYPYDKCLVLFQSSVASDVYTYRRLIDIRCTLYNGSVKLSAYDVINNQSNIGVYFHETDDFIEVYVSCPKYFSVCAKFITADSYAMYTPCPYSNVMLASGESYTEPKEIKLYKEVKYVLGENLSIRGNSQSFNKLIYDSNNHFLKGDLWLNASATGTQRLLHIDELHTMASRPSAFFIYCYSNKVFSTVSAYYGASETQTDDQGNVTTGFIMASLPTGTERVYIPLDIFFTNGI